MPEEPTGCLFIIFRFLNNLFTPSVDSGRYRPNPKFLTAAEGNFYRTLMIAVDGKHLVFTKVRLLEVITPDAAGKERYRLQNKVIQKHADFVLCDPVRLKVVAVIELDDSSHGSERAVSRDQFVDAALSSAGIPCVRIRCRASYNVEELRRAIGAVLAT